MTYEGIKEDGWLSEHIRKLPPEKTTIPRDKREAIIAYRKANFPDYLVRQSDDEKAAFLHDGYWVLPE